MNRPSELLRRLRGISPFAADAALAAGIFVLILIELFSRSGCPCPLTREQIAWNVVLALGHTVPLAWRRRYPFGSSLVVAAAATVQSATQLPPDPATRLFAGLVAVFSVAAYARRDLAVATLVVEVERERVLAPT